MLTISAKHAEEEAKDTIELAAEEDGVVVEDQSENTSDSMEPREAEKHDGDTVKIREEEAMATKEEEQSDTEATTRAKKFHLR